MMRIWKPGDFIDTPDCQRWENGLGGGGGAQTLNVASYILAADADATAGFGRAIDAAQALNKSVVIDVPAGTFDLSGAIVRTLIGTCAIRLRGAGSAVTIIRQKADADAFRITLGNYGPAYGLGGAFNVSGLTIVMAAAISSARTALALSTTGVTGNTGCPLVIDDVVIASPNPGAACWATGISVMAFGNVGYLTRITVYSANFKGVGITINGNGQSYTTAIFARDITLIGLDTGVVLGDFLQGIQFDTLFTVNTRVALQSYPTQAAGDNGYVFTNCYLYGKTLFHAQEGVVAHFQIRMLGCYIDGNVNGAGPAIDRHLSFINVPQVTLTGCTFNGAIPPASKPIIGLYIENQSYDTIVSNCTFGGYGAPGDGSTSVAMKFASSTAGITVSDNMFDYSAKSILNLLWTEPLG